MRSTFVATSASCELDQERLRLAKHAYTTRHLNLSHVRMLLTGIAPEVGDVVLARIIEIGQHAKIEQRDGRRAALFPGDEVVVAYGNRYAPDQFQAFLPGDLGPCQLVAAGGIAGRVEAAHEKMTPATSLEPLGLLAVASGNRVNLRNGAPAARAVSVPSMRPTTVAVVGTSMNSGKTTAAAHLVRGIRAAGMRVGAAKITGTGAGGDVWLLSDAGAFPVYDFTSAGLPSTYGVGMDEIRRVFIELTDRLAADGCEVVVIEVADGVYQDETGALLGEQVFRDRVDALLFAAYDALGATAGVGWLETRGLAPVALTGVLASSPLASREAEAATGCRVWGLEHLHDPTSARSLMEELQMQRMGRTTDQARGPDTVAERDPETLSQEEGATSTPMKAAGDLTRVA